MFVYLDVHVCSYVCVVCRYVMLIIIMIKLTDRNKQWKFKLTSVAGTDFIYHERDASRQ